MKPVRPRGAKPKIPYSLSKNTKETLFPRHPGFDSIRVIAGKPFADRAEMKNMISNSKLEKNVRIFDDEKQMLKFMIEKWENISHESIERRGYFTVALSGGKTPIVFYQKLAEWDNKSFWKRTPCLSCRREVCPV